MNDIVWTKSYEDYKTEVGQELSRASESFVRIGYLLKVARDTEVLAGTEFEGDYIKFAEREFGLEKTQVSRFIRINDKFSVDGNSEVLKDEYKGFGTRKLGIMLTLPDELTEELSPDLTVEEIETIQEEVKEEQKITPLEQYAETLEAEQYPEKNTAAELAKDDIIGAALYQIFEDQPELFVSLTPLTPEVQMDLYNRNECEKDFKGIFSPAPDTVYICRIKGVGRMMIICKEENVAAVNARTNEKQFFTWEDVYDAFLYITEMQEGTGSILWERIYKKEYPAKAENDKKEPENDKNKQKTEEKSQKTTKKSKVIVTKEKKDAKKKPEKAAEAAEHETVGEGAGEESSNEAGTPLAEAGDEVHDIQPDGSREEDTVSGQEDLGGAEGESLPSGTGETLPGEDSGAAGGEGDASGTDERNKYSALLENLTWKTGIIIQEVGEGPHKNLKAGLNTAKDIRQCISRIIEMLEEDTAQNWREVE